MLLRLKTALRILWVQQINGKHSIKHYEQVATGSTADCSWKAVLAQAVEQWPGFESQRRPRCGLWTPRPTRPQNSTVVSKSMTLSLKTNLQEQRFTKAQQLVCNPQVYLVYNIGPSRSHPRLFGLPEKDLEELLLPDL